MASYKVPESKDTRVIDFNKCIETFKDDYEELVNKRRKAAGYRVRKALLNMTKLARIMRKDVQDIIKQVIEENKVRKAEKGKKAE